MFLTTVCVINFLYFVNEVENSINFECIIDSPFLICSLNYLGIMSIIVLGIMSIIEDGHRMCSSTKSKHQTKDFILLEIKVEIKTNNKPF